MRSGKELRNKYQNTLGYKFAAEKSLLLCIKESRFFVPNFVTTALNLAQPIKPGTLLTVHRCEHYKKSCTFLGSC